MLVLICYPFSFSYTGNLQMSPLFYYCLATYKTEESFAPLVGVCRELRLLSLFQTESTLHTACTQWNGNYIVCIIPGMQQQDTPKLVWNAFLLYNRQLRRHSVKWLSAAGCTSLYVDVVPMPLYSGKTFFWQDLWQSQWFGMHAEHLIWLHYHLAGSTALGQ